MSMDQEGAVVVQDFARINRLEFSLVIDPQNLTETLYHLTGLPETYVLDKDGVVHDKVLVPRDWMSPDSVKMLTEMLGHGLQPARKKTTLAIDMGGPSTAPTDLTEPTPAPAHTKSKKKKK